VDPDDVDDSIKDTSAAAALEAEETGQGAEEQAAALPPRTTPAPLVLPPPPAPLAPAAPKGKRVKPRSMAPQSPPAAVLDPLTGAAVVTPAAPLPPAVMAPPSSRTPVAPFTALVTNVKGRRVDQQLALSPITIVAATNNRAGKTAILDGYRLALSGKHPIGATFADLCELTSDGGVPYAAIAQQAGALAFHVPEGKRRGEHVGAGQFQQLVGANATAPIDLGVETSLLSLSVEKLREALFQNWGTHLVADAALLALPEWLDEAGKKLWGKVIGPNVGRPVVDRLANALDDAKRHKLDLQASLRLARASAEEQAPRAQSSAALPPQILTEIKQQLDAVDQGSKLGGVKLELGVVEQQLTQLAATQLPPDRVAALMQEQQSLSSWHQQATAWLRAQGAPVLPADVAHLRGQLALGHPCPVCTQEVATLPAIVAQAPGLAEAHAQVAQAEVRLREISAALAALPSGAQVAELQTRHQRLTQALGAAATLPALTPDQIAGLRAKLTAHEATAAIVKAYETTMSSIVKTELEVAMAGRIMDELGTRLNKLLGALSTTVEGACEPFLPFAAASGAFALRLITQDREKKPTCEWRIRGADGLWHRYESASGVERAIARVAVACALAQQQPFRALLLDDEELGAANDEVLLKILDMVTRVQAAGYLDQVLVATSRASVQSWPGLASNGVTLVSV
jgi:hypothetical protein